MLNLRTKFLFILLVLVLSGCSGIKTQDPFYSAAVVTRTDLLSGKVFFGDQAKKIILPEDHVMEINDTMRAYLDRYVSQSYPENTKVRTLTRMIFGKGILGMEYAADKTHTAREAFLKTEGNCLSFSYLFTALARERGLRVSFQEVDVPLEWSEAGEELSYVSRHVNVLIDLRVFQDFIVDIYSVRVQSHYNSRKISDDYAIALYYSNKGTDYLFTKDYDNAFLYLVKALELSPRDAAIWSNLGVLYRMKGMYNYAEKAYFIALRYDGRQKSVLTNLSALYEHMGEIEKSEYYLQLAKNYQMKNPYYRFNKARDAFEVGDYELALSHLKVALKRQGRERKFYDLLGATYAKLGDESRANMAWVKAKELMQSQ